MFVDHLFNGITQHPQDRFVDKYKVSSFIYYRQEIIYRIKEITKIFLTLDQFFELNAVVDHSLPAFNL